MVDSAVSGLDFTVVVITRNRPTILAQCLNHLRAQVSPPSQVIVIDSSDQFQPVSEALVRHVHFPAGRGQMPLARNEGARLASTSLVAYIDDDCLVDEDWIEALCESYRENPKLAGVGGRISDRRWQFDPTAPVGKVTTSGRVFSNFFGDPGGSVLVDILPGGNMSFQRDWLTRVGGFDPGYVATNHREDPDLCLRIKAKGGCLAYQPRAHALHLNARTSLGELKPWHEFYLRYSFARNEAYFFARHFPKYSIQRWVSICREQVERAATGSLVASLCVAVQFVSYPLGLVSYCLRNWPRPRWHKSHS